MKHSLNHISHSILTKFSKHLVLIVIIAIAFKDKISSSINEFQLFSILLIAVTMSIAGKYLQNKEKNNRVRNNYDL